MRSGTTLVLALLLLAILLAGGRKESAAGDADDFEPGIACALTNYLRVAAIETVAPESDAADACAGVAIDALLGRPGLVGDGVDGEAIEHGQAQS